MAVVAENPAIRGSAQARRSSCCSEFLPRTDGEPRTGSETLQVALLVGSEILRALIIPSKLWRQFCHRSRMATAVRHARGHLDEHASRGLFATVELLPT